MQRGQTTINIVEYMNSLGTRTYTVYELSAIIKAIKIEFEERKNKGLKKIKTTFEKQQLNQRIADIVKTQFGFNITADDVHLFKKCRAQEYSDRTGKCAWGFKDLRKRLGYDPATGLEM